MVKQFYINGTGSSTFGIYITSDTFLNAPQIDYTEYNIPARYGSLIYYNKRLINVIRRFDCYIKDDVEKGLDGLKKLLYSHPGYVRIESDYDADTYQDGYLAQEITVDPFNEQGDFRATFSLYFSCKPQKYFKTNADIPLTVYPIAVNRVLPRNDTVVQQVFSKLSIDEIPNDDFFYEVSLYDAASNSTDRLTEVNFVADASCIIPFMGYDAYVEETWGSVTHAHDLNYVDFVFGSSFTGTFTWNGTKSFTQHVLQWGMSIYDGIYVLIPATFVGEFSGHVVTNEEGTVARESGIDQIGRETNPTAIGFDSNKYTLHLEGYYKDDIEDPDEVADRREDTSFITYGRFQGSQVFAGSVTIKALALTLKYRINRGEQVTIDIDPVKRLASMTYKGNTYSINDYVILSGTFDGIADEIDIYGGWCFSDAFKFNSIDILPTWWKV